MLFAAALGKWKAALAVRGQCFLPSMGHHPASVSERATFIFCECLWGGPLLQPLSFASQAFVYSFFPWECLRLNNRKLSRPQWCSWRTLKDCCFILVRIITAVFLGMKKKKKNVFIFAGLYAINCYRIISTNKFRASKHLAICPILFMVYIQK